MTDNIIVLDKNNHKNLRIKANKNFKQAEKQHLALLQAHEFTAAALYYPIAFIKDSSTGQFISVTLLGLQPDENLFYSDEQWDAAYIPRSLRGYPFLIAPETKSLCVDVNSGLVNEVEGEKLFNEDSTETEYLKGIKELLSTFTSQTPETRAFIDFLSIKNLLTSLTLTIQDNDRDGGEYQLTGIYAVDNTKLNTLNDSEFLTLKNKNYLAPIYAHLLSLGLVSSLIQRKTARK
jgi:hypothetical protein